MFDMFDSIKRGWLIKWIEAVEAVEAVEEDAIDAIVEDEDGIAVEAICGSDTMKKQVRVAQTSVFNTELYGMNNAWRERSKEKRIENRERERERIRDIREGGNWIMNSLNELKYSTSYLYINEFTRNNRIQNFLILTNL